MEYADEYTRIMQKMLADNTAAAEAVLAGARSAQKAAADALQSAREQLRETEENAPQLLQEFTDRHRARLEKEMADDVKRKLAEQLLYHRESVQTVAVLMDLPEKFVQELAKRQGRRKVGSADTWLEYDESGRSGYVILNRDKIAVRFSYEFAGGNALAVIDVPTAGHWEAATQLPAAERDILLDFVGAQVVADRAPGYQYRVDMDTIVIFI